MRVELQKLQKIYKQLERQMKIRQITFKSNRQQLQNSSQQRNDTKFEYIKCKFKVLYIPFYFLYTNIFLLNFAYLLFSEENRHNCVRKLLTI